VRQGGEVADRPAGLLEPDGEVSVAQAPAHTHEASLGVDLDVGRQRRSRHEQAVGVGDVVERVPGAERTHAFAGEFGVGEQASQFVEVARGGDAAGGVAEVAGPVGGAWLDRRGGGGHGVKPAVRVHRRLG
jgi:hypothetical protein